MKQKPTFQKNYDIIEKKHTERLEQEEHAPLLTEWAKILLSIQSKLADVEDEEYSTPDDALPFVRSSFDVNELNDLPSFANEIRTQIGYSIRGMSIASWNSHDNINLALGLINYALRIELDEDAKSRFLEDKIDLEVLQSKYVGILVCHFCGTNSIW